jgi:ribose 5-phosphate isomerase B
MKIVLGSDHVGFSYKKKIVDFLKSEKSHLLKDFGTHSEESCDYPDVAHCVTKAVKNRSFDFGILICRTGNGMAMTSNKYSEIRAGIAWSSEVASLIRQHNDANILVIPTRYVSIEEAINIVETFLETEFEEGGHLKRIEKIDL